MVVSVDQPSDAVLALIQWRRKDFNPENKDLIVIDAKTGKRITNVCRFQINREKR
ncbi:glycoside hydrolase domain-containing protein [Phocaeicola coprophilus]|uniref:glycoside hydrolase domain-containing protein n=1 Tax=Phocaeicola coprophilus TaxID=387090 RepID=UPI00399527F6